MAAGGLIGALRVTLGLSTAGFEKGATAAEKRAKGLSRSLKRQGQQWQQMGKNLSLAITAPLGAIAVSSAKHAASARDAMSQVEASLASMGPVAGRTREQLAGLAKELEATSTLDDKDILRNVTANMLTFGNVAGENFDRAQRAAIDMATKLGTDVKPAVLQVGKALNDPVRGMSALSEAGIQFSDKQRGVITALVESGQTAKAQSIILGELEQQFGGAAKAARDAAPGSETANKWSDMQERIGDLVLLLADKLEPILTDILDGFNNMSPGMQSFIVIGAGLAAMLGPLIGIIGSLTVALANAPAAIGAVRAAMSLLAANPAMIAVSVAAGAIYLAWQNWDKIQPIIDKVVAAVTGFWNETIRPIFEDVKNALVGAVTWWWDLQIGALKAVGKLVLGVKEWLTDKLGAIWDFGKKMLFAYIDFYAALPGKIIGFSRDLYNGVKQWVQDKLGAIWTWLTGKIDVVKGSFFDLYDAVVGHSYIPDMVDGIADEMKRLDTVMVAQAEQATAGTKEAFQKMASDVRALLDSLFPDAAAFRSFQDDAQLIAAAQTAGPAKGGLNKQSADAARRANYRQYADGAFGQISRPLSADMGDIAKTSAEFKRSTIALASSTQVQTVKIGKSFKDMASETISALDGMVSAIKGGSLLDALGSVVQLVLQLGSTGLFGGGVANNINKVPAYAAGTNFHPGGMAIVGERGPELLNLPRGSSVTPNNKLASGLGGDTYILKGNMMTPEFWATIQRGDIAAAQGGAQGAVELATKRQTRRIG